MNIGEKLKFSGSVGKRTLFDLSHSIGTLSINAYYDSNCGDFLHIREYWLHITVISFLKNQMVCTARSSLAPTNYISDRDIPFPKILYWILSFPDSLSYFASCDIGQFSVFVFQLISFNISLSIQRAFAFETPINIREDCRKSFIDSKTSLRWECFL